jgi:hypothetical protein
MRLFFCFLLASAFACISLYRTIPFGDVDFALADNRHKWHQLFTLKNIPMRSLHVRFLVFAEAISAPSMQKHSLPHKADPPLM